MWLLIIFRRCVKVLIGINFYMEHESIDDVREEHNNVDGGDKETTMLLRKS